MDFTWRVLLGDGKRSIRLVVSAVLLPGHCQVYQESAFALGAGKRFHSDLAATIQRGRRVAELER